MVALTLVALVAGTAPAGVVTQYDFDGNLLDTGSDGAFVDDLIGYNPVQEVTPPTFAEGLVGQAVRLGLEEGQANVLQALDSNDLDMAGDYTLEMFVLPQPEHGNHWHRLVEKWTGGMQYHFAINYPIDGLDLFMNGANVFDGLTTAPVPANEWTHVAFTGDSTAGETKIWVNGVAVGTAPFVAVNPGPAPLEFGNVNVPGQETLQYSGLIDDFAIHNTAQDDVYMLARADLLPNRVSVWSVSMTTPPAVAVRLPAFPPGAMTVTVPPGISTGL
jgi:hypothetical protein